MPKTTVTTSETPVTADVTSEASSEAAKYVVASQVKALVRSRDFCVGGDLIEALSARVAQLIETGIARASANQRKTLRASDI